MQKIIFLDFDGVLLTDSEARKQADLGLTHANYLDRAIFDPKCVQNLLELIHSTNAEIVLSTAWGLSPFSKLCKLLMRNGIDPGYVFEYDDPGERGYMTPRSLGSNRVHEIQQWLHQHPHVTDFVIIDDLHSVAEFKHHAVITDPTLGFDLPSLNKALAVLG